MFQTVMIRLGLVLMWVVLARGDWFDGLGFLLGRCPENSPSRQYTATPQATEISCENGYVTETRRVSVYPRIRQMLNEDPKKRICSSLDHSIADGDRMVSCRRLGHNEWASRTMETLWNGSRIEWIEHLPIVTSSIGRSYLPDSLLRHALQSKPQLLAEYSRVARTTVTDEQGRNRLLVRDSVRPATMHLPRTELFVPAEAEDQLRPAGVVERFCESTNLVSWTCETLFKLELFLDLRWGSGFPMPTDWQGDSEGTVCFRSIDECVAAVPVPVAHASFRWKQQVVLDTDQNVIAQRDSDGWFVHREPQITTGPMVWLSIPFRNPFCVKLEYRPSSTDPFADVFIERQPDDACSLVSA
jgi:hypothetical protein